VSERLPARADFEAVRHYAGEPCECPAEVALICLEVPSVACKPCRARKVLEELLKLSEEI
jgi:hypothetical protein